MSSEARNPWTRLGWRLVRLLHHADFEFFLPAIGRLPIALGHRLALWRGLVNAWTGRDWRSVALGFRHVRAQTALGYRALGGEASEAQIATWCRQRFVAEARDEYEAQLIAAGRVPDLACEVLPPGTLEDLRKLERGLILLTPHFESFTLGAAFIARSGVKVNGMSSTVTHDPRVDPAVQRHFTAKYRGLEQFFNGGKIIDLEHGTREFYRMLHHKEVVIILADAPVLPGGGSAMEVDFLGGRRVLAGGPLRMAQRTGSNLGCFVCRHRGGKDYQLEFGPTGLATDVHIVNDIYRFFSNAILENPGGWWAADQLPSMPLVAPPPPIHQTLVLTDSPLEGSQELELGLRQLRSELHGQKEGGWREAPAAQVPPADFLRDCPAPYLLVLLQPALLVTGSLPAQLQAGLKPGGARCAVAADDRGQDGEWTIGYTTRVDFERYVARRQALPAQAPWLGTSPWAYLVEVAAARELVDREPRLAWSDLPRAFAVTGRTVLAPRAFVHSYSDYQQRAREEMLELLPPEVHRLLDVGGGDGRFARAFIERRGGHAWLVEPSAAAGKAQPHERLHVFQGRLEDVQPGQAGQFDAISFLDVLEHMERPLDALLAARRLLRQRGLVLLSVPNVGHWSVVRDLALGRFDYGPVGILCGTHLRFFTARSLERLLGEAGFEVVRWRRAGPPMPEEFERFVAATGQAQFVWDTESLQTESLHVLAALR
jgi:lauroyl/myristoyl acyltransferase/SAM-dependent methyltransferase